jgi:hypothetical protein
MFDWIKKIFGDNKPGQKRVKNRAANKPDLGRPPVKITSQSFPDLDEPLERTAISAKVQNRKDAEEYIVTIRSKISALAERFAGGDINRVQFQKLYTHYQNEIQNIEMMLNSYPDSTDWRSAVTSGQSILIRHRNAAQVLGFAIYDNSSGMPLRSLGKFHVDPALFVPMLSSYSSAAAEIFGASMKSTQIEGGNWLCFIPGKLTTTMALFNLEPAARQLKKLEELQSIFENANAKLLESGQASEEKLVCPQEYFITHIL